MNQRTRYFLIGSALVVVVGLCTGVVAYYSGALSLRQDEPAELSYLPPDASAVAYANVQEIMNSGFRQRLRQMLPTGSEKDRLAGEMGVDIEKDIDSVVAAMGAGEPGPPMVLLRGRFDFARIEALAGQHGGTMSEYRGKRLMVGGDATHRAHAEGASALSQTSLPGFAFLEPDLVALGQVSALHNAIDASLDHKDITSNAALMTSLRHVHKSGNAWLVGRMDRLTATGTVPDAVRAQLPQIEWFSVSANVDQTVTGVVRAQALTPEAGEQLRSVVNGALAAARLVGSADPALQSTLASFQTSGSGNTAELSFTVTPEVLERMHTLQGGSSWSMPGGPSVGGAPAQ